jgi:hypothetical protein
VCRACLLARSYNRDLDPSMQMKVKASNGQCGPQLPGIFHCSKKSPSQALGHELRANSLAQRPGPWAPTSLDTASCHVKCVGPHAEN